MPLEQLTPRPSCEGSPLRDYLGSRLVRIGLGLLIVGSAPILLIILAAAVGLWPDPDPNPIGPGLLFFFTIWPSLICLGIGIARVRRRRRKGTA